MKRWVLSVVAGSPGGIIVAIGLGLAAAAVLVWGFHLVPVQYGPSPSPSPTPTEACNAANTQFDAWLSTDHVAADAEVKAMESWVRYEESTGGTLPSPSSPELTAAINQFNTYNQQTHAARQLANQDLVVYQAEVKRCDPSSLSAACREEFAQHRPLINASAREVRVYETEVKLIIAQQEAYRAGNVNALNAQTAPYNAADREYSAAIQTFNDAYSAHGAVANDCSTNPSALVTIALQNGNELRCRSMSNGATCAIHGTAQITSGMQVLLWVEPVSPASGTPGYYFQRGGVTRQPRPGGESAWEGAIQLGNAQYPPCRGDRLNVIVTLDEASAAEKLLTSPQQTYADPASAQQSLAFAEAKDVIVSGVPSCHH